MATNPPNNSEEEVSEGAAALVKTTRLMILILRMTIAVLVVIYVLSGFFYVSPSESAFVLRFGKIVGDPTPEVIEPGTWHWAWPKPAGRVVRIPKSTQHLETDYFFFNDDYLGGPQNRPRLTEAPGTLVTGTDGYLVTGNTNILHCKWGVEYVIDDPIAYYSTHLDPESAIRRALESAVLKRAARTPIERTLYAEAQDFATDVETDARAAIHALGAGVKVKKITYVDKTPPRTAVLAFQGVQKAKLQKSGAISRAKEYKSTTAQQAIGIASQITAKAGSDRTRLIAEVNAEANYFTQLLEQYREQPSLTMMKLANDTIRHIHRNADMYIIPADQSELRIQLDQQGKNSKGSGGY